MADRPEGAGHDPGGKVRLPLQPGVRGSALFSECGRYRYVLRRDWGDPGASFALWIGMNPSTAEADVDDPTIRKEMHFTRTMGFTSYVKCNVMDYRSTYPKALVPSLARSDINLPFIVDMALRAEKVIAAWGLLLRPLRCCADDTWTALAGAGVQLYCMGITKYGHPRHPLYLPNSAECVPWP